LHKILNCCKYRDLKNSDAGLLGDLKKKNMKRVGIKNGKRPTSHRYDRLPLLRSRPGGVQQELVVWDLPVQI